LTSLIDPYRVQRIADSVGGDMHLDPESVSDAAECLNRVPAVLAQGASNAGV
jgi:hypothetical protein